MKNVELLSILLAVIGLVIAAFALGHANLVPEHDQSIKDFSFWRR